jgi:hypothetical protein
MNEIDKYRIYEIHKYTPPKHRNRGKNDKPLMPQDRIDRLQNEIVFLKSKIETLSYFITGLDIENKDVILEKEKLKKKVEAIEILPKTWRKYPDSDGWKESCALDVEVALGLFTKCPLDGVDFHPRCMNLFDGICKSSTGLCTSAKKH